SQMPIASSCRRSSARGGPELAVIDLAYLQPPIGGGGEPRRRTPVGRLLALLRALPAAPGRLDGFSSTRDGSRRVGRPSAQRGNHETCRRERSRLANASYPEDVGVMVDALHHPRDLIGAATLEAQADPRRAAALALGARARDVHAERADELAELAHQASAIVRADLHVDPVQLSVTAAPLDLHQPLRLARRQHVGAAPQVNRDAATARDEADDVVARDRAAAAGATAEHLVGAVDAQPARDGLGRYGWRLLDHRRRRGRRLLELDRERRRGDGMRAAIAVAHRGVELLRAGVLQRLGDLLDRRVPQIEPRELALDQLAPVIDRLFTALLAEPLAHLVARARRPQVAEARVHPVAAGLRLFVGEDLDAIAGLERRVQRHDVIVDPRAAAAVADRAVDAVGEVERRRADRQVHHVAAR